MSGHGTRTRYVGGCRCEPCTEENRVYARELDRHHRRVAYGIEQPRPERVIDATEARDHLRWLASVGVGSRVVARRAGLTRTTVREIATGERSKCLPETTEKILAVGKYDRSSGARVDAADTWRKIDELLARGWTRTAIAQRIVSPNARALQIGRDGVRASTAEKVSALYAEVMAPVFARRLAEAERQAHYRELERAKKVAA